MVVAFLEVGDLLISEITTGYLGLDPAVDLVSPFDFRWTLGITGRLPSSHELQTRTLEIKHKWEVK